MNNFFKEIWNKIDCQKNGVCSINPVVNAISAVIINEIRQIAFYVVKLREFNLINPNIMKEAVSALCITIVDTDFNKKALLAVYEKLNKIKNEIHDFYIKKSLEMNISYEFISPIFPNNAKNIDPIDLIKTGEAILKHFYNAINPEKSRLIALVTAICKTSSTILSKLSNYKTPDNDYYFEILRLLNLTNNIGTREDKFIRRIKEFCKINIKLREELNQEQNKVFGAPESGFLNINCYSGKSILVMGSDLYELYNLLEITKNEKINIYTGAYLAHAALFKKFREYENFKGVFGTGEAEYDFSKFKGAVYITEHSPVGLDSAFRGTFFTTKLIPSSRAIQISKNNLTPLIEEAKKLEGFDFSSDRENIPFEYEFDETFFKTDKKIGIVLGGVNDIIEKSLKDKEILHYVFPNETTYFYKALNVCKKENISLYFSDCSIETIGIISSVLNSQTEIHFSSCPTSNINPHIIEALKKDFYVKVL